jgi:hypothetical protein
MTVPQCDTSPGRSGRGSHPGKLAANPALELADPNKPGLSQAVMIRGGGKGVMFRMGKPAKADLGNVHTQPLKNGR